MHLFLIVVAVNSVLLGFCFLIAGWGTLIGADEAELADLKQRTEIARRTGWFDALRFTWQWRSQFRSFPRISAHWVDRPQARRLIYVGVMFLAVAATVGYFLGVFDKIQT